MGTLLSCWSDPHKLPITSTRINSMKSIPAQTQVMNAKRDTRLAQRRVQRRELSASAAQRKSLEEKAKLKHARKTAKQAKKAAKRALKEVAQATLELEEARERLRRVEKKASKAGQPHEQRRTPPVANRAKPLAQKSRGVPMAKKAAPFLARRRDTAPLQPDMKRPRIRSAGKPARVSNKSQTSLEGRASERTEAQPVPKIETKSPVLSIASMEKPESSKKPA
jgi:hypothetical protein